MKLITSNYREWLRMPICVLLMAAALIGSGFINIPYLPVGLLLVMLINYTMLRSEGLSFSALGFDLKFRHLLLVPAGIVLAMAAYLLSFCFGAWVRGNSFHGNASVNWPELLKQLWRVLPTTAVQDFLVVGYCYHKFIRLTNIRVATIVVGLCFVSMHDVWGGNLVNDLFYALILFTGYLMFSTALLRSGSIWLVIGLHWGNNVTNSCVFTFNQTPTSWLFLSGPKDVFTAWQAIGLLAAGFIGAASVIALVSVVWRKRRLIL